MAGNRRLVHYATPRGVLSKTDSRSFRWTWPAGLALQLGGNALVAALMLAAPGILATATAGVLVLFLINPPPMGWMFVVLALAYTLAKAEDRPWRAESLSTIAAETVLQILSAAVMGQVVAYAALPQAAHMMYGGVLPCLTLGLFIVFCALTTLASILGAFLGASL